MARSSSTEERPGAYGLAISSDADLPGLGAASAATREVRHRVVAAAALVAAAGDGRHFLGANGEGADRVEYDVCGGGVLIRGGRFGDHLVAGDGGAVLTAIEGADPDLWRGHVLGQALPLAASLHGLEVFHAGAVAADGGVIALAGPSGVGKSTLVEALLDAGAAFFADDVLAVEPRAERLLAYPGTTLLARPLPGGGKEVATVVGERRRLPVRAFLRLAPDPDAAAVELRPCRADRLLETTFDGVSPAPDRPLRLLEVGAALAGVAHELHFPPGADPGPIAAELLERFGSEPAGLAVVR